MKFEKILFYPKVLMLIQSKKKEVCRFSFCYFRIYAWNLIWTNGSAYTFFKKLFFVQDHSCQEDEILNFLNENNCSPVQNWIFETFLEVVYRKLKFEKTLFHPKILDFKRGKCFQIIFLSFSNTCFKSDLNLRSTFCLLHKTDLAKNDGALTTNISQNYADEISVLKGKLFASAQSNFWLIFATEVEKKIWNMEILYQTINVGFRMEKKKGTIFFLQYWLSSTLQVLRLLHTLWQFLSNFPDSALK